MLLDRYGRALQREDIRQDSIYDPAAGETAGYKLPDHRQPTPEFVANVMSESDYWAKRIDDAMAPAHLDGFVNALSGIGDPTRDKSKGGAFSGPQFVLTQLTNCDAENRYRGTDIGRNLIERIPDEMTREGWDLLVQPSDEDAESAGNPRAAMDAAMRAPRRAAAGWRLVARRLDGMLRAAAETRAQRWDAVAAGLPVAPAALKPPPGPLPKLNDEGIDLATAMDKFTAEIGLVAAVNQALRYERAFGGGCVFIGVDDGLPLTAPLDLDRVRAVTHLTAFTGGWDGEAVMWRPYPVGVDAKYGKPEIFQVRNTSVQVARPPAPGEGPVKQIQYWGPTGPTIWYVHESRFLIFDGEPTSRPAQQEMRGWGDSLFTRVNDTLSQYEQTWNAVAILMQDFSVSTLAIKGLARSLSEHGQAARNQFIQYAQLQALFTSVARMRFIDADEKFERVTASVAGMADILDKMNLRLAACADTPMSVLFGQNSGGLGDADSAALRGFYDKIGGRQERRLRPQLERFYKIAWRAKNSPTKGVEPTKWGVRFRPLWKTTALEQAQVRQALSAADVAEIGAQIITPEEVAATRYGGIEYGTGPIVLDVDARRPAEFVPAAEQAPTDRNANVAAVEETAQKPLAQSTQMARGVDLTGETNSQELYLPVLPMTAMPSNPLTGDPQSIETTAGETGAGGKPLVKPEEVGR